MNINVLIVEDNPITSQDLKEMILENGMNVTGVAKNNTEAIHSISVQKPDILLVDINLKNDDSGIDLINQINKNDEYSVIYLTANSDRKTVEKAIRTHPHSYITKPYDETDVIIALELAFENHLNNKLSKEPEPVESFVFLKAGNKFEKVELNHVQYLEAKGSYTNFIAKNRTYTLSSNLNNVSEKISNPCFLRIHRSYIVNINCITSLDNDYVFIEEKYLPVSRSHREEVSRQLKKIS